MDNGEWEVLSEIGLHKMLGIVFTGSWQSRLRERAFEKTYLKSLEEQCGEEVLSLVQKLDDLLENDTTRSMAIALLSRPAKVKQTDDESDQA